MVQSCPLTTFKKMELGLMTNLWHVCRALTTCAVWKGDWQDREGGERRKRVRGEEGVGENGRVKRARERGGERE